VTGREAGSHIRVAKLAIQTGVHGPSRRSRESNLDQQPRSLNVDKMAALRRLLGASPARSLPPPVESDDVYPVHMLDDTKTLRDIVVTWTLRFNDVLDADNLYASLSRLLEIGDWRKVGGRLRLKVNFSF
jgi:hypothetical protein